MESLRKKWAFLNNGWQVGVVKYVNWVNKKFDVIGLGFDLYLEVGHWTDPANMGELNKLNVNFFFKPNSHAHISYNII